MKAVKMTPPDKWADDNGRDVRFCSATCGIFPFHVENREFHPRGLQRILPLKLMCGVHAAIPDADHSRTVVWNLMWGAGGGGGASVAGSNELLGIQCAT